LAFVFAAAASVTISGASATGSASGAALLAGFFAVDAVARGFTALAVRRLADFLGATGSSARTGSDADSLIKTN
jgi:hypothetical protein